MRLRQLTFVLVLAVSLPAAAQDDDAAARAEAKRIRGASGLDPKAWLALLP